MNARILCSMHAVSEEGGENVLCFCFCFVSLSIDSTLAPCVCGSPRPSGGMLYAIMHAPYENGKRGLYLVVRLLVIHFVLPMGLISLLTFLVLHMYITLNEHIGVSAE